MGWFKDTFLGGAEKKAAKQQVEAGDRAMATQKEYYEQARNDIMKLFPQAYQGIQSSFQQGIDQISAGKASASDVLRQAFNQSNQIQQSGSNAAISALLGRPQQMQLPQPMPQAMPQAGQTVGSKLMSNYAQPTGLRGNQFAQLGPQTLTGGMPQDRPMQGGGCSRRLISLRF
jgi:flagellar hook-basal body complex protein FliE